MGIKGYDKDSDTWYGLPVPKTRKAYRMFYEWCINSEKSIVLQAKKNLDLILSLQKIGLKGTRWNISKQILVFRRDLAIYRLYRTCNMSPQIISSILSRKDSTRVKDTIGDVYRILCLSDEGCIFRFVFEGLYEK